MTDIITNVNKYKTGWTGGLPETPCGHGSKLKVTQKQREWIPRLVDELEIKKISDIGAGDLNWISKIKFGIDVRYTPYDLVPRHKSVNSFNLLTTVPPKSDLLMCLWVLNHFPNKEHKLGFENLLKSKSKYLLITQRETWVDYKLDIIDVLVLNNTKDILIMAKL